MWKCGFQVGCKSLQNLCSPRLGCLALQDRGADLPVHFNHGVARGLLRAQLRRADQLLEGDEHSGIAAGQYRFDLWHAPTLAAASDKTPSPPGALNCPKHFGQLRAAACGRAPAPRSQIVQSTLDNRFKAGIKQTPTLHRPLGTTPSRAAGVSPGLSPAALSRSDMDWTGSRPALHSTRDLPKFGSVVRTSHPSLPWRVAGLPAAEDAILIEDFLITLVANDCSPQTVRSYAFDLLRWWRFLAVAGNRWDTARREDVRDLVLWMRQPQTPNGRRAYRPASINHALSVLSVFYEHQARQGEGPVMNPVPAPAAGVRRYAHHDPLDPYRPQQRAQYRQRVVDGPPRALSENVVNKVFEALTSTRDRALVAMYLATGARASELLGMRGRDVDWGNQSIAVVSKGSRAYEWVPTSPGLTELAAAVPEWDAPDVGGECALVDSSPPVPSSAVFGTAGSTGKGK